MLQNILATIIVYSLILTLANIYKDMSSYSFGLEPIDIIVAGPCMWIVIGVMYLIRPIYNECHKNNKDKPKKHKEYTETQIRKTVNKVLKIYRKKYKETIWLAPYNATYGCDETMHAYDIKLHSAAHEFLEKKYLHMCYNQRDAVDKILIELGHPVEESKDWETFKENSPYSYKKLIENHVVEI